MLESAYQARFRRKLEKLYSGSYTFKQDTELLQGIPDTLFLFGEFWAMFEVKRKRPTKATDFEPNQEWYLEEFDRMSFAACVYPENEQEVLYALQLALCARR